MKKIIFIVGALFLLSACQPLQPKPVPTPATTEEEKAKAQKELFMDVGLDAKGTIKKSETGTVLPSVLPDPTTLPAIDAPPVAPN